MTETAVATPDPEPKPERELVKIATPEDIARVMDTITADNLPNAAEVGVALVLSNLTYASELKDQLFMLALTGHGPGTPEYVFVTSVIADVTEMVGAAFGFDFGPYFDTIVKAAGGEIPPRGDEAKSVDEHVADPADGLPEGENAPNPLRERFLADQAAAAEAV